MNWIQQVLLLKSQAKLAESTHVTSCKNHHLEIQLRGYQGNPLVSYDGALHPPPYRP